MASSPASHADWSYDATMEAVKHSLEACLDAGYGLLHLDPTTDRRPPDETIPVDDLVARTVELLTHAEAYRKGQTLPPAEYDALMDLVRLEQSLGRDAGSPPRSFPDVLRTAVIESGRWTKWLRPEEAGLAFDDLAPERQAWIVGTDSRCRGRSRNLTRPSADHGADSASRASMLCSSALGTRKPVCSNRMRPCRSMRYVRGMASPGKCRYAACRPSTCG